MKSSLAAMQESQAGNEEMRVRRDTKTTKEPARINSLDRRFSERDLPFLALILGMSGLGIFALGQAVRPRLKKHKRFAPPEPERVDQK